MNGDDWSATWTATGCRIAVVDGAGHGPQASLAAKAALATVAEGAVSLPLLFDAVHRRLRTTRGGVMSVVDLDAAAGTLDFAGVGNVSVALSRDGAARHLVAQRGLLGATLPRVRPERLELGRMWTVVLTSDGVRSRFSLDDPELSPLLAQPQVLAEATLDRFSRADDDATVVVVTNIAAPPDDPAAP